MNTKFRTFGALVSAGTTLAIVAGLGAGVAHADPSPAGDRPIAMVGSETTTPVINALANDASALAIGGVRQVASFNATGSATIDTHAGTIPACTAITRPNGSSAGRTAFLASLTAADGCIQGARASSLSLGATTPDLVYIPFGRESITFAITNTSAFGKNLTMAQMRGFFRCTSANLLGGGSPYSTPNYRAMLPQNGSGTRSYWIGADAIDYAGAGITVPNSGPVPGAACVQNGADENSTLIEEHNGSQVNNFEIVPMSVAQWTSQTSGVISTDVRGSTRLGQLDSKNPFATDFGLQRDVYNVFSATDIDAATPTALQQSIQTLFKGASSQICTNAASVAIIKRFGLFTVSNCGDTTSHRSL
ncbi:hypothetical protein [Sporichthya sp.]|uniref:hypothetical protein n=1 Tax=Sporichthya sp. TaxID=65475 RepID=UPI0017E8E2ED|nr:hypothetical protein [Sporichthya sp.]MBA3744026.1 hypothetical protein [Sporichthya sp.]